MRPGRWGVTIIAALGLGLLVARPAGATPVLRAQIVQRGDFVLLGNTLAHDCSPTTPAPLIGAVGDCGAAIVDGAADVLWRADAPFAGKAAAHVGLDAGDARSSAVLLLPPGAVPTHAFLYWGAQLEVAGADTNVELERPGFLDEELVADACFISADGSYVCSVDVSELVIDLGPGLFRVGGVKVRPFAHLFDEEVFAAWWMVVVFERTFDPLRAVARANSGLRDKARRTEMLEEIGLAEAHARRAQDGVGGGDVEEEVGERESGQIVLAVPAIAHAVREAQLDLPIGARGQRGRIDAFDISDGLLAALAKFVEAGLGVGHGRRLDAAEPADRILRRVGSHLILGGERPHVRSEPRVEQGRFVHFRRRLVEPGAHVGQRLGEDRHGSVVDGEGHEPSPGCWFNRP
jgi:hypothetical protein